MKKSFVFMVSALIVLLEGGYAHATKPAVLPPATPIGINETLCIQHLGEAVRFQTVSNYDPLSFRAQPFLDLHAYLKKAFPLVHRHLKLEVINTYSLLYTWQGSDPSRKPIVLMAHQDVVPVDPGTEKDWTRPPFSGEIAEGFIWGRGTLDNKASMMAELEAVEALLKEGYQPMRTIYLAFGHDEEVSGKNGAVKIMERLKAMEVVPEYVIDEGGSIFPNGIAGVKAPIALVGIAEKGYLSIELSVEDKGGHSSMPPRHTAVGVLAKAITRLENHPFPADLTMLSQTLEYVADRMPFAKRVIVTNPWLFGPLVKYLMSQSPETDASIRTTIAATMISGSTKDNILPQKATAVINFRIIPGETSATVMARVKEVIDDPRVKLSPLEDGDNPSPVSSTRSPSYAILVQTIVQTAGEKDLTVAPFLDLGASDARFYARISKDVYRFLPIALVNEDLKRMHGTNERISTKDYPRMIQFYAQLIRNSP